MNISSKSVIGKIGALCAVAAMLALSTVVSVSQGNLIGPLPQWFEVLQTGDGEMLAAIVTEDATIELRDLDITQTRAEFIDSLDQWVDLNRGAEVLTRQTSSADSTVVLEACYRFSSNEVYNRETYTIANGQITKVIQEKIGDTCVGF